MPQRLLNRLHEVNPLKSRHATLIALVAAVLIGCLLFAGALFVMGGFEGKHLGDDPPPTEVANRAVTGDCLTWEGAEARRLAKLDCSRPHKFEVTEKINLASYPGKEFGAGSEFPGALRFQDLHKEHCVNSATRYLGPRFDPEGKFKVGMIFPGVADWNKGIRTLLCGLQQSGITGVQMTFTGRVADQDQSNVWPVGTCIGINGTLPTDSVGCDQQHAFEVVSVIDLGEQFKEGAPSIEDQDRFIEQKCTAGSSDYLGDPAAMRNKTLTMFWANISAPSWLAGTRKVYCSVGKEVDKGGFAKIVGSAKGNITIDGQAPVPPPSLPDGRSRPSPLPGAAPAPIPGQN